MSKREVAELRAFDLDGAIVEEMEISVHEYYDGECSLIDSDEYRAARGIVKIEGKIFDDSGKLDQQYQNEYSATGAYLRGRAVHADGTVLED